MSRLFQPLLFCCAALLASPAAAQTPAKFDGANTAWVLSASALVLFMTMPALALFYGGLVRAKNVLSVMMHCVVIACLGSVLWLVAGYSLAFSGGEAGFIGNLDKVFLMGVTKESLTGTQIGRAHV